MRQFNFKPKLLFISMSINLKKLKNSHLQIKISLRELCHNFDHICIMCVFLGKKSRMACCHLMSVMWKSSFLVRLPFDWEKFLAEDTQYFFLLWNSPGFGCLSKSCLVLPTAKQKMKRLGWSKFFRAVVLTFIGWVWRVLNMFSRVKRR